MLRHNLTKNILSNSLAVKAVLAFIVLALFSLMLACGKRMPPLPPIERVVQRVEVSGFQRGNQVRLSWTMPARNAPTGDVLNISRADIYRLAEPINSPESLTEDEFASSATQIASVKITDADFGMKPLSYSDTLDFAGQNIRLRYAIRFVNDSGSKASFSNFLLIEPAAKVANSPSLLPIKTSQEALFIEWKAPESNINGSKPANILGFNIYRAGEGEQTAKLLNQSPVNSNEFRDQSFEFGKNYKYFIRSVSLGTNAQPVESQESNIVEIAPKDIFPPNPPEGITLAATPSSISIFFILNVETDVVGYKIYRSTDETNWQLLTDKPITTNTFQDTKVESGKTYYYYLIAIDRFGNESQKSEVVSETIP